MAVGIFFVLGEIVTGVGVFVVVVVLVTLGVLVEFGEFGGYVLGKVTRSYG